jgi:hypothetical protein
MKLQKLRTFRFCCVGAGVLSAGMLFAGENAASRLKASADVRFHLGEAFRPPLHGFQRIKLLRIGLEAGC